MRKLISLIITLSFFIGFSKSHAQNINFFNQSYINQQTVTFQRVKTHPHASSCHLKREVVYKASYERILGTQCRRAKVGFEPGWLCRVSNRNNYQDWMDCAIGHVHNELYSTTPPSVGSKNQKRSILVDGKPNSEQETSQMDEYSTYLAMGLKTLPSVLKMGKEHFNSVNSGIKESRNKVEANINRLNGFITNNEAINEDIIEETNQFLNQTTKKLNQKLADQEKIQQASNKVVSELKTSEERLTQKINDEINLKGIFDNIMSQKFNPFAYSDAPITSYPLPNTMTPSRDDFLEHHYKFRAGQLKDSNLKKELFEKSKLVTKFVKAKSDDLALQMAEEMEEYSLKDKGYIREVETPLLNRVQKFENDLTQYDIKGQILKDKIKNNLVKNPEMSQKALDISQGLREASEETFYKGDLETGEKGISLADNLLDMGLDFVPYVSTGKSAIELFTGKNPVTGEDLTAIERGISGVSIVLDAFSFGTGSIAVKSIAKGGHKTFVFLKNVGKKIFNKSNWKKAKKGFNEALDFGKKSFDSARKSGLFSGNKFNKLSSNSSYETVKSFFKTLGKSNIPLPIKKSLVKSFDLKTIKKEIVDMDLYVYRWHNNDNNARKLGRFLSDNPITDKNTARRLLALPSNNKMLHLDKFKIKKGTEIYRGKVAPLNGHPGGGDQIFVTGDNLEKILLPALD